MRNPFSRFTRARDKPRKEVSEALTFFMGGSLAGKRVNERSALQLTTVYACVRVIAETIASLPLHVYRTTDTGSERAPSHPLYQVRTTSRTAR